MRKPDDLRELLLAAVPQLKADPAKLSLYVDKGRVAARDGSLSFEHRYTLHIVAQDFAGEVEALFVPLLAWIAEHQPELLQQQAPQEPFTFEVDLIDGDLADIAIDIELTERVRVERGADGIRVTPLGEPPRCDVFPGVPPETPWQGMVLDVALAGGIEPA